MRSRRSPWRFGLLAAGFALSLAAVGCGDDDTTDTGGTGGSSGKGGSSGSSAGKGGSSGSSGKGGGGGTGGAASPDKCISDSTDVFKGQSNAPSAECISCICNEGATAVEACNAKAKDCWGLVSCYDAHGCTPANQNDCVPANCADFIGGATPAMGVSPLLTGDKCSAKCALDTADAGTEDAGK